MEASTSYKPSWKNKRKKSFYNEEADAGFIFRKPRRSKQVAETPPSQEADKEDAMVEEEVSEGDATAQSENLEEDESLLEVGEGEEELLKEVELKRFIAQLKKGLLASHTDKAGELDTVLEQIAHDLKQPDLYFCYMQSSETNDPPPDPLERELKENIASFRARKVYLERELEEWDEVTEASTAKVEHAKLSYSSQKHVDFLNLKPENVEALRSYLTPEQVEILDKPSGVDECFVPQVSAKLEDINSKVDQEFELVQQRLAVATAKIKSCQPDNTIVSDTPKTVFRALQNHA